MTDLSPDSSSPPPRRRWLRRCAWMLVTLCLLAILLPNLVLQLPVTGRFLKEKVRQRTGLAIDWQRVWWNPARGLVFRELSIPGPEDGAFAAGLKIESITMRPDYLALPRKKLVIREVEVVNPVATVLRAKDGSWLIPGRFGPQPVEADPNVVQLAPLIPSDPATPPDANLPLPPPLLAMGNNPAQSTGSTPNPPPGPAGQQTTAQPPAAPPPPPPPDGKLNIQGGKIEVISARDGKLLAKLDQGSLSLGPSGGSAKAQSIGCDALGQWRECQAEFPLRWVGSDLLVTLAERTESERSLQGMARFGLAPGLPVAMEVQARNCPVGWLEIPAKLGNGLYPASGEFSGTFRLLALAAQPGAVVALVQAEASNLALPTTSWPGGESLDQWFGRTDATAPPGQLGIGKLLLKVGMRGSRVEVPVLQIDAGGMLAASQFLIGPGLAMRGETNILLGTEGEDRVRRFEERLVGERKLGFTGNTTVQLPDGNTAQWKSRVIHWGGFVHDPMIDLWPDLGFLRLPEIMARLQSDLRPEDPDKVKLIPLLPP